jgi:hypothetical protein
VAGVIAAARDGKANIGVAYDAQLVSLYNSAIISPSCRPKSPTPSATPRASMC